MKNLSIHDLSARALVLSSVVVLGFSGTAATAAQPTEQSSSAQVADAQAASKAFATHPDYVLTPKGVFAHKDCVHALEQGDVVDRVGNIRKKDGTIQVLPSCAYLEIPRHAGEQAQSSHVQPATDNGWTETAFWNAPSAVGEYASEFHVPAAPSNFDGQLIYIFPGLQGGGAILQAVIQYGNNGAWGGQYWSMNTWAGGGGEYGGNYYYGNAVTVNTGDVIYNDEKGYPDNCNGNGCLWEVVGSDLTNGQVSSYSTYINISWTQVLGLTIEVYGVDTCADYPATYDNAYDFYITGWESSAQWTPQWSSDIWVETCGESITSNSGLVNLYY